MKRLLFLLPLLAATPALAADLNETLTSPPEQEYTSRKALVDVERCIVLGDMPDMPAVYRAPERPNESLIYYPKMFGRKPALIQLEMKGGTTLVKVWHPNGGSMKNQIAACAA